MKNNPKQILCVLLIAANCIFAQNKSQPDFEIKKDKLFQSISKSFQELKEGYSFSECSNCEENAITLDGEDYTLLNAVSFAEKEKPEIFNREERAILGYMKGKDKCLVLVSVYKFIDESGTIFYSNPELMLYNSRGYKISQLDLGTLSIAESKQNSRELALKKGFPNFKIIKECLVRDYSFFETIEKVIGYDENTFEEKKENKKIKVDEYFKISFNENGFIIDKRDGTQIKLRNNFLSSSYRKYVGEINYPNGSKYMGTFQMNNDFKPEPIDLGEFKNKNEATKKGRFCRDTVLCNFPKFFIGNETLGEPYTEFEKDRKLSLKNFRSAKGITTTSDGNIVSVEYSIKTVDPSSFLVYMTGGGNFSVQLMEQLNQINSKSKIYIDLKYKNKSNGALSSYSFMFDLE